MGSPKISQLIFDNAEFLKALARTRSIRKRKRLLKYAGADQLLALVEICLNILLARFRLTTRQRKRLLPHAEFVRKLARRRTERSARQLLVQKGSGIGGLFASLLTPIIIELAKNTIFRNKE